MASVSGTMELTLTLLKGSDTLDQRVLAFPAQGATIRVGRASPTASKQLQPAKDNCWIQNSVVSRDHAIFSVGTELDSTAGSGGAPKLALFVADSASRHGTCINGKDIRGKGKIQLRNSDKVQFGEVVPKDKEPYEPPVFAVQISSFHDEPKIEPPITKPLRFSLPTMSSGRAFAVPDDYNDESDMSESSESELDFGQSHSSPPLAADLDRKFQAMQDIMLEMNNGVTKEESLEGSVADERASLAEMVQSLKDEVEAVEHLPSYEDLESYFTGDDEEAESGAKTPDGTPHGPPWPTKDFSYQTLAYNGRPPPAVILPSPHTGSSGLQGGYTDGPFVQGASTCSLDFDEMTANSNSDDHSGPWPCGYGVENCKASTITKSTQEILDSTHAPDTKKDMSISSLMNPEISTKTNKRKAAEFEQDDMFFMQSASAGEPVCGKSKVEYADAATTIVEPEHSIDCTTAEPAAQSSTKVIEIVKMVEASTQPVAEPRPSKRLRTIATHTGSFVLGALSLVAGLMALPDDYFT